jgi:argininosuccinate lyase
LKEITRSIVGREIAYTPERLAEILSPEYFVRVRTTPGGPAPAETTRAIATSEERLATDEAWIEETTSKLRGAEAALNEAVSRL